MEGFGIQSVNAVWFQINASKPIKILDVVASLSPTPPLPSDQPIPPVVLLAFRTSPKEMVQVGCHVGIPWSEVLFGNRNDSTYLIMAGIPSDIPSGPFAGSISLTTSEVGILEGRYTVDNSMFFAAQVGDTDPSGYTTITVVSTAPRCDAVSSTPANIRWTVMRTGVMHESQGGKMYTTAFRVPGDPFETGWWFDHMGDDTALCDTMARLPVAQGIARYSFYDDNYYMTGGKSDHFRMHLAGSLTDLTGTCPGGKTNVDGEWQYYIPNDCPMCFTVRHADGPRLSCQY